MSSRFFERALTFLLATVTSAVAVGMLCLSFGIISVERVSEFASALQTSAETSLTVGFIGLLLLLFSGLLVFFLCRSLRKASTCPVYNGANGACFIATSALKKLVRNFCATYRPIKDCFTNFVVNDNEVSVGVRLIVSSGAQVGTLTDGGLNDALKQYLQTSVGLAVREVDVLIENVADPADQRG